MENKTRKKITGMLTYLAFFAGILFFLTECTKSSPNAPSSSSNEVVIQNYAFNPSSITVHVNDTVKWINKDQVTHTVTSDNGLFDSGSIQTNGTYSQIFRSAGTFAYHCSIHTYMKGTVVVN